MNGINLEEQKDTFLQSLSTQGKSFNTIKNYRTDLNIFKRFLAEKGKDFVLKELTDLQLQEYDLYLNQKYNSPNSIRRRIQALRIFFDFLITQGLYDTNPIKKIITKPKVVDLPKPATFSEICKVKAFLEEQRKKESDHRKLLAQRNIILLYLIYGAGLKVSDIESLHLKHIKREDQYRVIISPEKRDPYTITLPLYFNAAYETYLNDLEAGKNRDQIDFNQVFFNANPFKILKGGLTARGIEVIFKELSSQLEFKITAKSLRQAGIFNWLLKEVPEARIKEWMGVQPQYSLRPYKDLLKNTPEKYPYMDFNHD